MGDLKGEVRAEADRRRADLIGLSHRIHSNPEVKWEERQGSAWCADVLEAGGFAVERGVCNLPTAFVARTGNGPLRVAICAEYDALPGVGHACGHNVIASAAVGAGLALAPVADRAGLTVSVMGTPAEEGGGGKVFMLEGGAFDGSHAAMMVHPAPFETESPIMLALAHLLIRYTGREAHAAAAPHLGINAADAMTVAQVGIGLLRQHVLPTDRVHGIVTKGGDAPNIVPADVRGEFIVRSRRLPGALDLKKKVLACFEAGALATGATLEVEEEPAHAHVQTDAEIAGLYRANAEGLGRVFPPDRHETAETFTPSTDFGNVSVAMPSIHPFVAVEAGGAVNHQKEFAAACANSSADRAVYDGAVAMAWTALDLAAGAGIRDRLLRSEFHHA